MIPMKQMPLSALATVSAGQSAPKDNEFSDSGTPFVRAGSLDALLSGKCESELELVSEEIAKLRRLKVYPKGTILFAKSGMSATKDRIYVLQNPAHVVSHLATLIPKDGAHVNYLRLALKRFPPSSLIKDPAYPAIGLGEIESFEIPVPEDYDDQIRIAHLLGKVEGLIAQRQQHLQQLDDLLKSVFLEMFGDPVRNEKGWDRATFKHFVKAGTILEIQDGNHGNDHPKVSDFSNTGLPFVTANVVRNGRILFDKCYYLQPVWLKKLRIGFARPGDVLLSHKGTLGLTAVLDDKFDTYIFSPQTTYYRVNAEQILPVYLKAYFDSDYFQWLLRKEGGNQATRAYLGITKQKELPLMLPPMSKQQEFALVASQIAGIRVSFEHNLTDLETLYGALSQQAFKGELDLSRVPLPRHVDDTPDQTEQANSEPTTPASFQLPEPEAPDWLAVKNRPKLFEFWLTAWCERYAEESLTASKFLDAASQRLVELTERNAFQFDQPGKGFDEAKWYEEPAPFSINEYEQIKEWVFDALASGKLMQGFDNADNRIQLKAAQA